MFDKFQNWPKIIFTKNFEIYYSGVYFKNIWCVCDLPTYYPNHIEICDKVMKKFDFGLQNPIYHSNSTLNSAQDRKNHRMFLVTMFNKFQNETQIIFTKNFEIDYKGVYFKNIWCVCDLPTYHPNHIEICDKVMKTFHFGR